MSNNYKSTLTSLDLNSPLEMQASKRRQSMRTWTILACPASTSSASALNNCTQCVIRRLSHAADRKSSSRMITEMLPQSPRSSRISQHHRRRCSQRSKVALVTISYSIDNTRPRSSSIVKEIISWLLTTMVLTARSLSDTPSLAHRIALLMHI